VSSGGTLIILYDTLTLFVSLCHLCHCGVLQYYLLLTVFNALMFVFMCQLVHHLVCVCVSAGTLVSLCLLSVLASTLNSLCVLCMCQLVHFLLLLLSVAFKHLLVD